MKLSRLINNGLSVIYKDFDNIAFIDTIDDNHEKKNIVNLLTKN